MQLTSLITAAGLAVSAGNAFLLPLSEPADDGVTTLPVPIKTDFTAPTAEDVHKLQLSCPGCPVRSGPREDDAKAKIKTDMASHLELDFSIDHDAAHDRLMLNGFELYPKSDPMRNMLGAQLLPDSKQGEHQLPSHRKHRKPVVHPLGFGLRSSTVAHNREDSLELVQVDLQIIEVGNVFVDGIPNVEIKLVKTPEGGLLIGGLQTTASENMQSTPMDKQEECTTSLCKWRAMLMQQLARLGGAKGCGGRRPAHVAGQIDGFHRHPHHGHHNTQHHRQHRFSHLLKNIASHILLPVAVGIAAGILASILGMVVGTAIVCLWRTFVRRPSSRRHRRSHSSPKAAPSEAVASDEKAGLMAHQEDEIDAPPAYVEEGRVDEDKTNEDQA